MAIFIRVLKLPIICTDHMCDMVYLRLKENQPVNVFVLFLSLSSYDRTTNVLINHDTATRCSTLCRYFYIIGPPVSQPTVTIETRQHECSHIWLVFCKSHVLADPFASLSAWLYLPLKIIYIFSKPYKSLLGQEV